MDLGIAGRKAIVCASSKGLGRACARALAEAGCAIVINGRDSGGAGADRARTARGDRRRVREILGDLDDPATRAELIAACPDADILVNNNGGPPRKAFDEIRPRGHPQGRRIEHADPDRAHSGAGARHGRAQVRPDRQHHFGFGPCAGRGPRRLVGRARGPHRLPRLGGAALCARQRDDQFDPARLVRDRPAEGGPRARGGQRGA